MKDPTTTQLEALRQYANENGRTWKSKLNTEWMNGTCDSNVLMSVRNQLGPTWLTKFKLVPTAYTKNEIVSHTDALNALYAAIPDSTRDLFTEEYDMVRRFILNTPSENQKMYLEEWDAPPCMMKW